MIEYITKEQAIELLHYNSDEKCTAIIADVEELEPADVAQVVHAKWKHKYWDVYACSNCRIEQDFDHGAPNLKYCPNCGARMDGEE